MIYGIFSIICLLSGSILLGQGIYKDDIRMGLPSLMLLVIGITLGIIWIINCMSK